MYRLTNTLALALSLAAAHAIFATPVCAISASGGTGPSTTTSYNGTRNGGFTIVEDVAFDPNAGPWHKELVNATPQMPMGMMIFSGVPVLLDETFTNVGSAEWTDWHERVLSRTDVGSGNNYPGFLFLNGSLSVFRNGSPLTQGVDYTLSTVDVPDQVSAGGDWESMSIFFSPASSIKPGDSLHITKQIFEVFGNGKIWEIGEAAVLAQFPTVPEAASMSLALIGSACMALSRSRRHRGRTAE